MELAISTERSVEGARRRYIGESYEGTHADLGSPKGRG